MVADWRQRPERGGRRITRFYIWLCLRVGRRMARPILYGIALYFFLSAPNERRHSAAYLRRIFGRRPGAVQVYRHFFTFSTTIMDRLFFLAGRTEHLSVKLHGMEDFDSLRRSHRGFLLASGHFGSFEAMRILGISEEKLPIKVLMYLENARQLNDLMQAINPELGKNVIPLGKPGAMLEVKEWIEQGGIVGILADRIVHGEKLAKIDFLGGEAEFPLGPWLLAGTLQIPVMLCFAVYRGLGHYDVYFETLSDKVEFKRGERMQEAQRLACRFAERLAQHCRSAPYNWFNFYDFWATAGIENAHRKSQ